MLFWSTPRVSLSCHQLPSVTALQELLGTTSQPLSYDRFYEFGIPWRSSWFLSFETASTKWSERNPELLPCMGESNFAMENAKPSFIEAYPKDVCSNTVPDLCLMCLIELNSAFSISLYFALQPIIGRVTDSSIFVSDGFGTLQRCLVKG